MRAVVALLLLGACQSQTSIDLSLVVDASIGAALVIVDDGADIEVWAEDVNGPIRVPAEDPYVGRYPLRIYAFLYDTSLAATGLSPGRMTANDEGLPVPIPAALHHAEIVGEEVAPFALTSMDALPPRVRDLRLPRVVTLDSCVDGGGCFDLSGDTPGLCLDPCPAPPQIMPPALPNLSPCPAGDFATGVPGATTEVRPGELAAAAAAASPDTTLLLAKGTFDTTVSLPDRVDVRGACAAETRARGFEVRGRSTIRGLTLEGGTHALVLDGGAQVSLLDAMVRETTESALYLPNGGAVLRMTDVELADIGGDGKIAHAVHQELGTQVIATRLRFQRMGSKALDVDAANATLTDITIIESGLSDCEPCSGLCVFNTSSVTASRIQITEAYGRAIMCKDQGCDTTVHDALIERVHASNDCTASSPTGSIHVGQGLAANGGRLKLEGFEIRDCDNSAATVEKFFVQGTSELFLSSGTIKNNPTGVEILTEDHPLERLVDRVVYENNGVNLAR